MLQAHVVPDPPERNESDLKKLKDGVLLRFFGLGSKAPERAELTGLPET